VCFAPNTPCIFIWFFERDVARSSVRFIHDLCFPPLPLTSQQAIGNHFFEFFGTQTIFARVAVPPGEKVTFSQNTFYLRCPVSYVYFLS